jgi:catechol 2,3-dioxygenase-like lactoylglutathione lyase family enzyme
MRSPRRLSASAGPLGRRCRMVKTQGLTHIHLVVRDLERSLRFYGDVFGMEERFRDGPHMVFLNTPGSNDLITLNQDSQVVHLAGSNGGVAHFGFRLASSSDLDTAIAEVERAGGKLLSRGKHPSGPPFAYVTDPDGYIIEL